MKPFAPTTAPWRARLLSVIIATPFAFVLGWIIEGCGP